MTATETYKQVQDDFSKILNALLRVKTIDEIHIERRAPGYKYNQTKAMHEYWIALSKYSVSANLSLLAFAINGKQQILPSSLESRQDIIKYCEIFEQRRDEIVNIFNRIIDNPDFLFIGYAEPITMEQYLQNIISDIHDEALNLEYNYNQYKSLNVLHEVNAF